ncbi:Plasmodium exported protein, unknown function [Plasmodium vivax]|uniref:Fam-l protein n=1 Tax=Plasmodium vivax TaxID=5855 RepID=A0A1G4E830_PLAVI|nr:Plasmodium exported protein, unknown function [Plasmodium vivax]
MMMSKNCYIKSKIIFFALTQIIAFIFIIWIYEPFNVMDNFGMSKKSIYKHNKIEHIKFYRSLSKQEFKREYYHPRLSDTITMEGNIKQHKFKTGNISPYENLNKSVSSNLDLYKKRYKKSYSKKKGLLKLEGYLEKKVFDKFDYIGELAERLQNNKKSCRRKIISKYGIPLIFFAFFPALGLIFPIIFGTSDGKNGVIDFCNHEASASQHNDSSPSCNRTMLGIDKSLVDNIGCALKVFSFTMIIIVLFFVIYTIMKFIKYESIKEGKDKMSLKEYCTFCKKLLRDK